MGLKGISIKRVYDTTHRKAADEFFNPALADAFLYQRATAYFSSSSFRLLSTGLSSLFWSRGKMQLLVGKLVSENDWDAIASSKDKAYKEISKVFPSIEELKKMMEDDNVRAFAELLGSGSLEMKFVLSSGPEQLFHSKFGIIMDREGDGVAFAGSINETEQGLGSNIEVFSTFKSWIEGEREYYELYSSLFSDYWEGVHIGGIVVSELPEELKEQVVIAAKEYSKEQGPRKASNASLRPYQRKAVDYWKQNGYRGMLEMATGTGKTRTALECVNELVNEEGRHPIIIAVPTGEVAKQWSSSWMEYFGRYPRIYTPSGGEKANLQEYASIFSNDAVIIATYNFLAGSFFSSKMLPLIGEDALLIADEAHHLGAKKYRDILSGPYRFRLGLSATPHRLFDDEGNDAIETFFGKESFSYSLEQAIADGYLAKYDYFPKFVELSDEEVEEYSLLTRKISRSFAKYLQSPNEGEIAINDNLQRLIYIRAKIVKKASAKYNELNKILEDLKNEGKLSKLMIFCEDKDQLEQASKQLDSLGAVYRRVSGEKLSAERAKAINDFGSGDIDAIISMKVMDEGVDIEASERAILMSSSRNPRQYIQRAGRVLRKSAGKKKAEIFDIIVYVDPRELGAQMEKIERVAIRGEILRAEYFTSMAHNRAECNAALSSLRRRINI